MYTLVRENPKWDLFISQVEPNSITIYATF